MDTSLRKQVFSLRQNVDTSLYNNVSIYLKEAIIQPRQYSWHDILSLQLYLTVWINLGYFYSQTPQNMIHV